MQRHRETVATGPAIAAACAPASEREHARAERERARAEAAAEEMGQKGSGASLSCAGGLHRAASRWLVSGNGGGALSLDAHRRPAPGQPLALAGVQARPRGAANGLRRDADGRAPVGRPGPMEIGRLRGMPGVARRREAKSPATRAPAGSSSAPRSGRRCAERARATARWSSPPRSPR